MINYHNKKFKPAKSSENSETDSNTIFHYQQKGNILTCQYSGGHIVKGHLIGLVSEDGSIDIRYQQINHKGELMTGICNSKPEIDSNGKITLYESWQWTSGDKSIGNSVLEEI